MLSFEVINHSKGQDSGPEDDEARSVCDGNSKNIQPLQERNIPVGFFCGHIEMHSPNSLQGDEDYDSDQDRTNACDDNSWNVKETHVRVSVRYHRADEAPRKAAIAIPTLSQDINTRDPGQAKYTPKVHPKKSVRFHVEYNLQEYVHCLH